MTRQLVQEPQDNFQTRGKDGNEDELVRKRAPETRDGVQGEAVNGDKGDEEFFAQDNVCQ